MVLLGSVHEPEDDEWYSQLVVEESALAESELGNPGLDKPVLAPKPKASARKKISGSASSTTPPTPIATSTPTTTVVAAPRLSAAAKGTGSRPGVPDVPSDDSEEELLWNSSDDEDVDEQTKGREESEGDKTNESDDDDDNEEEVPKIDEQEVTKSDEGDDEATKSDRETWKSSLGDDCMKETFACFKGPYDLSSAAPISIEEKSKKLGRVSTEMELILEHTQQGISYEVSISTEGVEELKRNDKIKGVKKEALLIHLGRNWVNTYAIRNTQLLSGIEDSRHVTQIVTHWFTLIVLSALRRSDNENMLSLVILILRVKSLEDNFSNIPGIVNQYMHQQMPEVVREAMQTLTNQLQDSIQRENNEFIKTIDENMKKIIKEQVKTQVKAQVTRILPRIEEAVNAQLEAKVLTRSSHSLRTSYVVAADLSEMELKKILIEKMEGNKSIQRSGEQRNLYKALVEAYDADKTILDTYGESTILKRRREDNDQEGPSAGSDQGSKRQREEGEHASASTPSEPATGSGRTTTWSQSRQLSASEPPTPDRDWNKSMPAAQGEAQSWISVLAKQTDARSSFNELLDTPIDFSNFIMNRLSVDTLTPELLAGPTYELMRGSCQQYPHNLLQPLPLIPNNRGRSVIPFEHFINNDLEYLQGGASSRKYTTSVTKTKATDYGHIKWIEDLGRKRQQFYGFAVNWESALDVYSKRRIIAVTELRIVEWHNYKHLDWISVRRDDDKIYKFKEGDLKRLRIQDIEDMLLLLVQGKLFNLTVEERLAFNVSLRMFTRSIVIQRRRREAYTAHSNPRGFIYQNKDKKNRLMRIDELHKFNDETLNDVRNALDDRLKRIRMQYLPTTIWRSGDKARAAAMIQAIDKMLKTRRIIRSLERFVGRRQYEGDFRMLQRTI
uniref:Uncharacterized protein n=1 Tax=Tanacetum cinerariifolium TaxID=118510 RepID=A0A6L2LL49_TANCI|nr:hypothetical protein [Tanacetum cinerariifolium]